MSQFVLCRRRKFLLTWITFSLFSFSSKCPVAPFTLPSCFFSPVLSSPSVVLLHFELGLIFLTSPPLVLLSPSPCLLYPTRLRPSRGTTYQGRSYGHQVSPTNLRFVVLSGRFRGFASVGHPGPLSVTRLRCLKRLSSKQNKVFRDLSPTP